MTEPPLSAPVSYDRVWTNWAGNHTVTAAMYAEPRDEAEVVHVADEPAVDRSQPLLADIGAEARVDFEVSSGAKVERRDRHRSLAGAV